MIHRPPGRERLIEEAIIKHPEALGFPGALAIRDWWISATSGRLDLALFPTCGARDLVLIEAKGAKAADAASKVIGQLLMYYAAALELGSEGLTCLRRYALDHRGDACSTVKKSVLRVTGGIRPKAAAWAHLARGAPVAPERVALFLAIDDEPHRALRPTLRALHTRHGISIGLAIVRHSEVVDVEAFPAG